MYICTYICKYLQKLGLTLDITDTLRVYQELLGVPVWDYSY